MKGIFRLIKLSFRNFKNLKRERRIKIFIILGIIFIYFIFNFLIFYIFKVLPDFAYYLLPKVEELKTNQKILIISPHPDDEIINTGGLIQKALENNNNVKIILVTDGNKHKLGKLRINQFKKATSFLGINEENLVFLNLKDGGLQNIPYTNLKNLLLNNISNFNPDLIIYPSFYDKHPDHKIIGKIIEESYKGDDKIIKLSYLTHYEGFPQPRELKTKEFLLPPYSLAFVCQWKVLDLQEDEITKKEEALKIYNISLSIPIEKNFLFSFIRKNELFCEDY